MKMKTDRTMIVVSLWFCALVAWAAVQPIVLLAESESPAGGDIGREVAVPCHLQDGQEFQLSLQDLIAHGTKLFTAMWTIQEGGGRPLTKGTGAPLSDPHDPLEFPRNFNRLSAPDANSCAGCHNAPFGIPGGGGDIVANVFVLGQRFDFVTFDPSDPTPTKGAVDELGHPVTQQTLANSRATLGMFGAGFIEMLARQMAADLQTIRDATGPGEAKPLISKGISFGTISRHPNGTWDVSGVEGIPAKSLVPTDAQGKPSLIIRSFHQAGAVVSLREFTNNAFNHHHGIQATERFGLGTDADGDGFVNELTRADVTAATLFQATLAVPGRVIPNDPEIEQAVLVGEQRFADIGCATCHLPRLPLDKAGWVFTEPNPYNPAGNLKPGEAPTLAVDLTSKELPGPRLTPQQGVVQVPAFTDLKLHNICSGPEDPSAEPLDMQQPAGSAGFFAGNQKFITRKLWGAANEPPFFHHGQFTTLREAILAHSGEALTVRQAFETLSEYEQGAIIEFLKTLQVLPPGTQHLIVDEDYKKKKWPPNN
jgi:cytochrome c peroxidase